MPFFRKFGSFYFFYRSKKRKLIESFVFSLVVSKIRQFFFTFSFVRLDKVFDICIKKEKNIHRNEDNTKVCFFFK